MVLGQPDVLQGLDLNIKLQLGAQGRGGRTQQRLSVGVLGSHSHQSMQPSLKLVTAGNRNCCHRNPHPNHSGMER